MTQQDTKPGKPLADLLQNKWLPSDVGEATVGGLCLDHRKLNPGDLFIAIAGTRLDGRQFINDAIQAGAGAVVKTAESDEEKIRWIGAVPVVPVAKLGDEVSAIAGEFYGHPSRSLNVLGVTGTNGKSTCSHLLAQLYDLLGQPSGVAGTLGYGLMSARSASMTDLVDTGLTTADPIASQRILAELKDQGAKTVAMEVSSHSLDQGRVADIRFAAALFTNLTRDHLDYHGSMEEYGLAKRRLFQHKGLDCRVINLDDAFGRELASEFSGDTAVPSFTYALGALEADIHLRNITHLRGGVRADIVTPWGEGELRSGLLGDFNLSNVLGVVGVCCAQGHALNDVLRALPQLKPVPGRMEQVCEDSEINVIVDYAHTPDSLEQALKALRDHVPGNLVCIFGCGGDRDRGKRPLMAEASERRADQVIVTSDNPRSEVQSAIADDIRAGFQRPQDVRFIDDRSEAIKQAILTAQPGDCVLIAGKGHETYQQVGDNRLPFSDVKQARLALLARNGAEGSTT
ncbi:UDP-N-acetylmuramoyl-L-alanyl-D-glutamate--2,6-diaminopimelate ligase [Gilvimarinus sp. F26214L]|uniref:UDP-N-acetylmuramoyl-L-alanyl-D-glutamate--2, 6-diaminopimelate ligase n=1 Tax=Gilvimarinus sp. DZF01 TaxID=3461371 RepID=UPI0040461545